MPSRTSSDVGSSGAHERSNVGDELRDVEACRQAGVTMVRVAWGLTDAGVLRASGIEIASTPQQLQDLLGAAVQRSA
jgi:phosphoglycolate phosphatase-like HAD superfamily hydrolase